MTSIEFEVRALLDRRIEACQVKDIDRLMALYAPHIVYFDVVPPNQFRGTDEAGATSCGGSMNTTAPSAWKRTSSISQ